MESLDPRDAVKALQDGPPTAVFFFEVFFVASDGSKTGKTWGFPTPKMEKIWENQPLNMGEAALKIGDTSDEFMSDTRSDSLDALEKR